MLNNISNICIIVTFIEQKLNNPLYLLFNFFISNFARNPVIYTIKRF